jgi:nicotinate phosphoribosyltransferase
MNPLASALTTDLYQLTMLHAYFERGMRETAVFELFVRKLPPGRNFLLAAGLEPALEFLEDLRFAPEELEWIERLGLFGPRFAQDLERLRFTGEVHALPEGTVFFPNEPVLRVIAPLPEAQLVESRLINLVHYSTVIASKAARAVLVAPGKRLVDFGLRRSHGAEAGLLAARSAYLAGFAGTSAVSAGMAYGIPVFGTMAHSFVQAHEDEARAFEDFARVFPRAATLLIDTYDTEEGARKVAALAPRLRAEGIEIGGVRLDSGDLGTLAKSVRRILDEAGLGSTTIFASGNLDERRVRDLLAGGAPIDGFGVGTSLVTSDDAPHLDAVYKLQEYAGTPRRKRSTGKATWPGRKQVWRERGTDGRFARDTVSLETERFTGEPLVGRVMAGGRRLRVATLAEARSRAADEIAALPARLSVLEDAARPYAVVISPGLQALARQVDAATGGR